MSAPDSLSERKQVTAWLTRLADGDRSAFDALFEALWPRLRQFIGAQLPGSESEELAQEVLVRLFERANEFTPGRDGLAWAYGIAGYEVLSARKRRHCRREDPLEMSAVLEHADPAVPIDEMPAAEELWLSVERCVGALSAEDAATVRATLGGERFAVSAATFRKRLSRALARLREQWGIDHDHE